MERPPNSMVALNAPRYDIYFVLHDTPLDDTILSEIIRQDDIDALNEYLLAYPHRLLGPMAIIHRKSISPDVFEFAASWGAIKVLCALLDYELKHPNQRMRYGAGSGSYSLLVIACRCGQVVMVKHLLDTSPDVATDIKFRDTDGWTPLLAAADALANGQDYHRDLDMATYKSYCEEMINLLLDKGAVANDIRERRIGQYKGEFEQPFDIDRRMYWGSNDYDVGNGDWPEPDLNLNPLQPEDITTYLVATVLSLAASRASPAIITRLITLGADPLVIITSPTESIFQMTPLHIAASHFNAPCLEVLINHCGNSKARDMVTYRNKYGDTPLISASYGVDRELVIPSNQIVLYGVATFSILLHHCSAEVINARNDENDSALQVVERFSFNLSSKQIAQELRTRVVKLLVDHGATSA